MDLGEEGSLDEAGRSGMEKLIGIYFMREESILNRKKAVSTREEISLL